MSIEPKHWPVVVHRADVPVRAHLHPFDRTVTTAQAPAGLTIGQILGDRPFPGAVLLDGYPIPARLWGHVRPKAGATIDVYIAPEGGGGGGKVLRSVLQIAVVAAAVAAPGLAPAALAGSALFSTAVSVGISVLGNLAINALIPPSQDSLPNVAGQSFKNLSEITGVANRVDKYGAVTRPLGKKRLFPKIGGKPYTEYVGDTEYAYILLILGYGPLSVSDIKIGETALEDYNKTETLVQYDIGENPKYYTQDSHQDSLDLSLATQGDAYIRTTQQDINQIGVDLVAKRGFFSIDKKGSTGGGYADFKIEYRVHPDGVWQDATAAADVSYSADWIHPEVKRVIDHYKTVQTSVTTYSYGFNRIYQPGARTPKQTASTLRKPVYVDQSTGSVRIDGGVRETRRSGMTFSVPTGQYDVRVTRGNVHLGQDHQEAHYDEFTWTALKSSSHRSPVVLPGVVKFAARFKADDSLSGVINQINMVVQSHLRTYANGAWTQPKPTSNCAWAFVDALAGPAALEPLRLSQLNGPTIANWAKACSEQGWEYTRTVDAFTSGFDLAKDIAMSGFAAFAVDRAGFYSVVRDLVQLVPRQTFSPRNTRDFSSNKTIQPKTHALRVQFKNREKDWDDDEVFVYNDGYNAANATRFETLQLAGIDNVHQGHMLGRYHLAAAVLRPETYTFNTDIRHLYSGRGDVIRLNHDVPEFGMGSGFVIDRVLNSLDEVIAFTIDDEIIASGSEDLVARATHASVDGSMELIDLEDGHAGKLRTFRPDPPTRHLYDGDFVALGTRGKETVKLKITRIETTSADQSAKLTLVDAAPEIEQAFTNPIPPYQTYITQPIPPDKIPPSPPYFVSIVSDDTVAIYNDDGSLSYRVQVNIGVRSGTIATEYVQVELQEVGAKLWDYKRAVNGTAYFGGVDPGDVVNLRIRSVARSRVKSDWVYRYRYVVTGRLPLKPTFVKVVNGTFTVKLIPESPRSGADYEYFRSTIALDAAQIEAQAVNIGQGKSITDSELTPATTYYYFVRTVNLYGASGFYGLSVRTLDEANAYLKLLSGRLNKTELVKDLRDPIELISDPDKGLGSKASVTDLQNAQETNKTARVNLKTQISASFTNQLSGKANINVAGQILENNQVAIDKDHAPFAQATRQVQVTDGDQSAAIQQLFRTHQDSIKGLNATYHLKVSGTYNGKTYFGGFGLGAQAGKINGVLDLDELAIGKPGKDGDIFPFIFDTTLEKAVLKGAVVQDLTFDKLKDSTGQFIVQDGRIQSKFLAVDRAQVKYSLVVGPKPPINADVTGDNTARGIIHQGILATSDSVDYGSAQVSGKPVSFRLLSVGSNSNDEAPDVSGFYLEDGSRAVDGYRSYNLVVVDRATQKLYSHKYFDVYGNRNGRDRADFRDALNGLSNDVIVAIFTDDEPKNRRIGNGLASAIYRCGGSRAIYGSDNFSYRGAYILVGIPGIGPGNGIELYSDTWVETAFTVNASGQIQLGRTNARDALDIGYADGTAVEDLKPAQANADKTSDNQAKTIVGQGDLATVNHASWGSQVRGSNKPADNADVTGDNTANDVKTGGGRAVRQANADHTNSNKSADTDRVSGVSATTVVSRANRGSSAKSRTDDWTRPNSTRIDGNKIYTGDAYVDTLQIKNRAVTAPFQLQTGRTYHKGDIGFKRWFDILTLNVVGIQNPEALIIITGVYSFIHYDDYVGIKTRLLRDGHNLLTKDLGHENTGSIKGEFSIPILDQGLTRGQNSTYRFGIYADTGSSANSVDISYASISFNGFWK